MTLFHLQSWPSLSFLLIFTTTAMRTMITTALSTTTETSSSSLSWPVMARHAFTPSECDAIIDLYTSKLVRMEDTREADSVSRINRFDYKGKLLKRGDLDWILDRVASKLSLDMNGGVLVVNNDDASDENDPSLVMITSGEQLKPCIDFTLLHEFNPGMHFGLHVDTKPNDGTHRTYNVNIMLSDPSAYQGGALQVGNERLEGLEKGDLYMYPASLPHAVHQLDGGLRYTYVMALTVPLQYRSNRQQELYWAAAEGRFHALMDGGKNNNNNMGDMTSRLHLIHAQFLEASGDRTDADIDAAYCKSYKATPEAALYAQEFLKHGTMAQDAGDHPDAAANYFKMAVCVDPTLASAVENLIKDKKLFGVVKGTEL